MIGPSVVAPSSEAISVWPRFVPRGEKVIGKRERLDSPDEGPDAGPEREVVTVAVAAVATVVGAPSFDVLGDVLGSGARSRESEASGGVDMMVDDGKKKERRRAIPCGSPRRSMPRALNHSAYCSLNGPFNNTGFSPDPGPAADPFPEAVMCMSIQEVHQPYAHAERHSS